MLKKIIVGAYFWLADKYEDLISSERLHQCNACDRLYIADRRMICPHCKHREGQPISKREG